MSRNRAIFDAAVLAVYLLAANPLVTGIPLHEFLGLGAFTVMGAHIVASGAGLAGRGRPGRIALNAVLLLSLSACAVSGVMVSGTVLPALGLCAEGYHFWDPLHALAAKVLLAALLVHLTLRAPAAWAALRGNWHTTASCRASQKLTRENGSCASNSDLN